MFPWRRYKRSGAKFRVVLDFDGVLAQFFRTSQWRRIGPPVEGALAFVHELLADSYDVVIVTTRPAGPVQAWLQEHGFPPLEVTDKKPSALVYLDDKGHRFDGDWAAARAAIRAPTWWQNAAEVVDDAQGKQGQE